MAQIRPGYNCIRLGDIQLTAAEQSATKFRWDGKTLHFAIGQNRDQKTGNFPVEKKGIFILKGIVSRDSVSIETIGVHFRL
jgi:hypothetical protein